MNIERIFVVVENSLLAVKYKEDSLDVFADTLDQWTDVNYLNTFFETHKKDLQSGFYGKISIEEAIDRTIDEADSLAEELLELAEKGKENLDESLQTLFKPLNNKETLYKFQSSKAYGEQYKSWLRIYAIRIAQNKYIVSGSAIKLTEDMERAHLQQEIQKLKNLKDYLKDYDLLDDDTFEFLEI